MLRKRHATHLAARGCAKTAPSCPGVERELACGQSSCLRFQNSDGRKLALGGEKDNDRPQTELRFEPRAERGRASSAKTNRQGPPPHDSGGRTSELDMRDVGTLVLKGIKLTRFARQFLSRLTSTSKRLEEYSAPVAVTDD